MPGTENSESNADKDAQEQLWDDKKVLMGKGKGDTHIFVMIHVNNFSSWLCFLFRMIHQSPAHVMSQESSELFKYFGNFYYYWLYCRNTTINKHSSKSLKGADKGETVTQVPTTNLF